MYEPLPLDAVAWSWVEAPAQRDALSAVALTISAPLLLTVTVTDAVAVQPAALLTVTVYVVVLAGLTVLFAVVVPLLHAYPVPPLAVRVVD